MQACILIRTLPGKTTTVLGAVKKFPEIKSAFMVFGRYDVVAFAEAPNYEAICALTARVNAVSETKNTESLIEG